MIDVNAMIMKEIENGYGDANAQAKVCQDLILKAIATSRLNRNVTIKGVLTTCGSDLVPPHPPVFRKEYRSILECPKAYQIGELP